MNASSTTGRNDPRYVDSTDTRAVLRAWVNGADMGAWADDDEDAFRAAVIDEARQERAFSPDCDPDGEDALVIERA